ncbi:MAG TPA: DUF6338 family protein [Pirellulales bacterium]|nr:DUF6338 family protein [Pirellulales bacterium]
MPSLDVLRIINALLPGFLTAWIFYGLTAHPRKDMFERTVQAFIFSAIVQVIVYPIRELAFAIGRSANVGFGIWSEETTLSWSIVVAAALGFVFAGLANNNTLHGWLSARKWFLFRRHSDPLPAKCWTWTKRTAYPSEWFSAFNEDRRRVILHLGDERRIEGWPYEWPDQPEIGHFVLLDPYWIVNNDGNDQQVPLGNVKRILIAAKNVEIVEIMKTWDEIRSDRDKAGENTNGQ